MIKKVTETPKMVLTPSASVVEVKIGLAGSGEVKIDWDDGNIEEFPIVFEKFKRLKHRYAEPSDNREITIAGTDIWELACQGNRLTNLEVRDNKTLWSLNCRKNKLSNLDINRNVALAKLNCAENRLSGLNAGVNPDLFYLVCSGNQLTNLYLGVNPGLWYLDCSNNQLANLNVPASVKMNYLFCRGNRISALDVHRNPKLTMLDCSGNKLTSLLLRKNTALELLDCSGNQLSADALNDMLDSLHENPVEMKVPPDIVVDMRTACISDNPGTELCDPTEVIENGWMIRRD